MEGVVFQEGDRVMNCRMCKECIPELALGGTCDLPPGEKERAEAHLKSCKACREELRKLRSLFNSLCSQPAPEFSQEVLDRVHDNVMRRIREERPSRNLGSLVLSFGAAAAAVVLCISTWRMVSRPERPLPPVAQRPDPVPAAPAQPERFAPPSPEPAPAVERGPTLEEQFAGLEGPQAALAFLREHFDAAAETHEGGDFRTLIALCDTLITRWPESCESLDARKLISRCHTQLADHEAARCAFLDYADEAGRRRKQELLAQGLSAEEAAAKGEARTAGAKDPRTRSGTGTWTWRTSPISAIPSALFSNECPNGDTERFIRCFFCFARWAFVRIT